jgi:hypothetical protein
MADPALPDTTLDGPGAATVLDASPAPTDDEVVAIMAAVEALWPRPVAGSDSTAPRNTSWRFSGRWWSLPLPVRRDRPFR